MIRALEEQAEIYVNQKNLCSVVLQATINHHGHFTDVSVGNLGRDRDAHVLYCSNIFDAMDARVYMSRNPTVTIKGAQIPLLILADEAYPTRRSHHTLEP